MCSGIQGRAAETVGARLPEGWKSRGNTKGLEEVKEGWRSININSGSGGQAVIDDDEFCLLEIVQFRDRFHCVVLMYSLVILLLIDLAIE